MFYLKAYSSLLVAASGTGKLCFKATNAPVKRIFPCLKMKNQTIIFPFAGKKKMYILMNYADTHSAQNGGLKESMNINLQYFERDMFMAIG